VPPDSARRPRQERDRCARVVAETEASPTDSAGARDRPSVGVTFRAKDRREKGTQMTNCETARIDSRAHVGTRAGGLAHVIADAAQQVGIETRTVRPDDL
jgi:hypothetical protein